VSGEKTVKAEPLLEAKIVSVVSTSLLRGIEGQRDPRQERALRNLAEGAFIESWASETADGGYRARWGSKEAGGFGGLPRWGLPARHHRSEAASPDLSASTRSGLVLPM
jgi:hypothetical protein